MDIKATIRFFVFSLFCYWMLPSHLYAQSGPMKKKISIRIKNKTLPQAIKQLERKTQVYFSYDNSLLPAKHIVNLEVKEGNLKEVCLLLLKGTNMKYELVHDKIILQQKKQISKTIAPPPAPLLKPPRNISTKKKAVRKKKAAPPPTKPITTTKPPPLRPPPTLTPVSPCKISGYLVDHKTGEKLVGANIVLRTQHITGTSSNNAGFFSLQVPSGKQELEISYIGYKRLLFPLELKGDTALEFRLHPNLELPVVEISPITPQLPSASASSDSLNSIMDTTHLDALSVYTLTQNDLSKLPTILGESDVINSIGVLPGVLSSQTGDGGMRVRGGSPDQNLILLEGIPVYNPTHFFGFFSIFNADAVQQAQLIRGNIPARFGERLSSILNIQLKEGNNRHWGGNIHTGLISSKVLVEGPIWKNKSSLMLAARMSHLQPFSGAFQNFDFEEVIFNHVFYDLNARLTHRLSPSSKLSFSFFKGGDVYEDEQILEEEEPNLTAFQENIGLDWGNQIASFHLEQQIGKQLLGQFSISDNRYNNFSNQSYYQNTYFYNDLETYKFETYFNTNVHDIALKADIDYIWHPKHYTKFGGNITFHNFSFDSLEEEEVYIDQEELYTYELPYFEELQAQSRSIYIENDWQINSKFKLNAGLRLSSFLVENETYTNLQPRLSLWYQATKKLGFKAAYSRMSQYLHLLTLNTPGLPFQIWFPSNEDLAPMLSHHFVFGIHTQLGKKWTLQSEVYYKNNQNLVERALIDDEEVWEEDNPFVTQWEAGIIQEGKGWDYGWECLLEKKRGKTTALMSYALAWSVRQFERINENKRYYNSFDSRHQISLSLQHQFSKHFDVAALWTYRTGFPFTIDFYQLEEFENEDDFLEENWELEDDDDDTTPPILSRNNARLPNTHRLDISVNFHHFTKWGKGYLKFGLYNIYNKRNPLYIERNYQTTGRSSILKSKDDLPLLPELSYQFTFGN